LAPASGFQRSMWLERAKALWRGCRRRCCCRWGRRRGLERELAGSTGFLTPAASEGSFASLPEELLAEVDTEGARRRLCSELSRAAGDAVRVTAAALQQPGNGEARWRDCSSPGKARCWVRIQRGGPRAETQIVMESDTADHVEAVELVKPLPPATASGALLVLLEFGSWPQWMPMCQAANIVQRWGPAELLARVDFKLPVVGLHLLCDAYVCLVDRLEEEGCLEVLVCSAGSRLVTALGDGGCGSPASDGRQSFMGVPLRRGPSGWLSVRAEVDFASLRLWPTEAGGLQHRACFVLSGEERCPVDSVIHQIWRMFSRNFIAMLASRAAEFPVPVTASQLAFYEDLQQRIAAAAERATAARSGV